MFGRSNYSNNYQKNYQKNDKFCYKPQEKFQLKLPLYKECIVGINEKRVYIIEKILTEELDNYEFTNINQENINFTGAINGYNSLCKELKDKLSTLKTTIINEESHSIAVDYDEPEELYEHKIEYTRDLMNSFIEIGKIKRGMKMIVDKIDNTEFKQTLSFILNKFKSLIEDLDILSNVSLLGESFSYRLFIPSNIYNTIPNGDEPEFTMCDFIISNITVIVDYTYYITNIGGNITDLEDYDGDRELDEYNQ